MLKDPIMYKLYSKLRSPSRNLWNSHKSFLVLYTLKEIFGSGSHQCSFIFLGCQFWWFRLETHPWMGIYELNCNFRMVDDIGSVNDYILDVVSRWSKILLILDIVDQLASLIHSSKLRYKKKRNENFFCSVSNREKIF